MLLSNPEAAAFISKNFIPCWQSVRPVPKVTIDFGDGRVMRRTLKGNTVFYVVTPEGRVVDALPGVYTPSDFIAVASESLRVLHDGRLSDADALRWHREQVQAGIAQERIRTTMSKAAIESPLLNALDLSAVDTSRGAAPSGSTYAANFERICDRLDDVSSRPMPASKVAPAVGSARERGMRAVRADSRTNVQLVRAAVHLFFAAAPSLPTPDSCKSVVFKRILHVDIDDPNLGLGSVDVPGTP